MNSSPYTVIAGSGSYIPDRKVPNSHFLDSTFFDSSGQRLDKCNHEIIAKFKDITGIEERRYVTTDLVASDIAFFAAEKALKSGHIDKETLDCIIVAHNFGDVPENNRRSDSLPSLASRVKQKLGIHNQNTIAYDVTFGCAGWLQGVIQANCYIKSGEAQRVLVIGAETLSRVSDPHDRDSMIYSDGAGAVILEARISEEPVGILSTHSETFADGIAYTISMDKSFNPDYPTDQLFLKMNGHKLYEYALKLVPQNIKKCIDKAGLSLSDIGKLLIHQANHKMDTAILDRLAALYSKGELGVDFMPMTIASLGNSSVATVPTLYDLLSKGQILNHKIAKRSTLAFAAVGAGISINSLIYRLPQE